MENGNKLKDKFGRWIGTGNIEKASPNSAESCNGRLTTVKAWSPWYKVALRPSIAGAVVVPRQSFMIFKYWILFAVSLLNSHVWVHQ